LVDFRQAVLKLARWRASDQLVVGVFEHNAQNAVEGLLVH
jgi:hypothetical protein